MAIGAAAGAFAFRAHAAVTSRFPPQLRASVVGWRQVLCAGREGSLASDPDLERPRPDPVGFLRDAFTAHTNDDGVWFNSRSGSSPLVATEREHNRTK